MIDTQRRHRRDATQTVGGKKALEGVFRPRRVAVAVGNKDQLELAKGCEQGLVLPEKTLEASCGGLTFIEEGKARDAGVRYKNRKAIGKIHQPSHVAAGQQFGADAALRREEIDFAGFIREYISAQVREDEVQHHEPGLDVRITFDAAVL
jgi:hypothetical protein